MPAAKKTEFSGLDLAALAAFVAVGEKGGFRAAAEGLGMSSAGVSKAVGRLEAELGVSLFARTTRSVRLTSAGVSFHARCKAILADLHQAALETGESSLVPRGRLTISMPVSYGRLRVIGIIARYAERYPEVEIEARLSDRFVDLVQDGVDVAVRIGDLPDSSLKATRVAQTSLVLCASPGYLARAGVPAHPDDLINHAFVGYILPGSSTRFVYHFLVDGTVRKINAALRLVADDGEALVEAALHSAGLVMVADYVAERYLADGSLVRLLRTFEMPPVPISIVQLPTRNSSPAARAFTIMVRQSLGQSI